MWVLWGGKCQNQISRHWKMTSGHCHYQTMFYLLLCKPFTTTPKWCNMSNYQIRRTFKLTNPLLQQPNVQLQPRDGRLKNPLQHQQHVEQQRLKGQRRQLKRQRPLENRRQRQGKQQKSISGVRIIYLSQKILYKTFKLQFRKPPRDASTTQTWELCSGKAALLDIFRCSYETWAGLP